LDAFVQDAHGANRKGWIFSTGAGKIVETGSVFSVVADYLGFSTAG
jgi:hypothetical protein